MPSTSSPSSVASVTTASEPGPVGVSANSLVTTAAVVLGVGVGEEGEGEGVADLGSIKVKSEGKSGTVEKSCAATEHGAISAKATMNAIRQNLAYFNLSP